MVAPHDHSDGHDHGHSHSAGCLGWWTRSRHYVQLNNGDPNPPENMERRGQLYALMGAVYGLILGRMSVTKNEPAAKAQMAELDQLVAVQHRDGRIDCVWHREPSADIQQFLDTAWVLVADVPTGHVHHQWTDSCC